MADLKTTAVPSPRAGVLRMKEYHPPLGGRNGLRLDFNENTFECSPRVLEALRTIGPGDLTRYPEREPVEAMVARHLGLEHGQTLLTNGVDEAIHVLCQTYLDAGDEVLFPVPTYSMYEVYASGTDAQIVTVQGGADFAFPLERVLDSTTARTKLILLANPNSPTGTTITREQILTVAERAPQAAVVVDEAYFHFFGETVVDLIGTVPNLLVARTFSKAYGLAGLRLGLIAGPKESIDWMRRVISPYSVNSLALACLPPALEDDAYLQWYVGEVLAARAAFVTALDRIGVPYWPSRANFVLLDIGAKHKPFVEAMRSRGVLVRDRSNDPGCDGCVRVTIGLRKQTLSGEAALEAALDEIGWQKS